ncbi:hypothetical protein RFI_03691 [Reticulomyxa filosa]|uniref:Transmembrane protein n=1 Tax=Reticulomyxa filosa TaxID=46433 RepID=X6P5G5_RETFI|nr:hypothetical protein RFI_03691 [Reticulomyxa filosa]|eukprot:ETO33416.1 hypothetical protein RFI_03691 [Reticulomyxa filosa]
MDPDGGNITDYFELFKNYQVLDEMDKDLMKKLLCGHTICSHCFRPYKYDEAEKYTDRLFRWQVLLEILSYYVFVVCIWVPLIFLLTVPAAGSKIWMWINLISKPQIKSTESLAGSKVEMEDVDLEYKTQVHYVIQKNNASFQDDKDQDKEDVISKRTLYNSSSKIDQPVATVPFDRSFGGIKFTTDLSKKSDVVDLQKNMVCITNLQIFISFFSKLQIFITYINHVLFKFNEISGIYDKCVANTAEFPSVKNTEY